MDHSPNLSAMPIAFRQIPQLLPGRILHRDAVLAGGPARLRNSISPGYNTSVKPCAVGVSFRYCAKSVTSCLNVVEITERGDVEHGHEATIVVTTRRLDAEAKSGQQTRQNFDDRGQAVPL